jgi:hypothetical protein
LLDGIQVNALGRPYHSSQNILYSITEHKWITKMDREWKQVATHFSQMHWSTKARGLSKDWINSASTEAELPYWRCWWEPYIGTR